MRVEQKCSYLMGYYLKLNKYPTATDSFEDAVNIDILYNYETEEG